MRTTFGMLDLGDGASLAKRLHRNIVLLPGRINDGDVAVSCVSRRLSRAMPHLPIWVSMGGIWPPIVRPRIYYTVTPKRRRGVKLACTSPPHYAVRRIRVESQADLIEQSQPDYVLNECGKAYCGYFCAARSRQDLIGGRMLPGPLSSLGRTEACEHRRRPDPRSQPDSWPARRQRSIGLLARRLSSYTVVAEQRNSECNPQADKGGDSRPLTMPPSSQTCAVMLPNPRRSNAWAAGRNETTVCVVLATPLCETRGASSGDRCAAAGPARQQRSDRCVTGGIAGLVKMKAATFTVVLLVESAPAGWPAAVTRLAMALRDRLKGAPDELWGWDGDDDVMIGERVLA